MTVLQEPNFEIRIRPNQSWFRVAWAHVRLFHDNAVIGIIATGIALLIFQIGIRACLVDFGPGIVSSPFYYLPRLLLISFYDFVYSGGLILLFLLPFLVLRKSVFTVKSIQIAFVITALMSLIVELMDLQFVRSTGVLFSYQWLSYSEFFSSVYAHQAIRANISWISVSYGIAFCVGFLALSIGLKRVGRSFSPVSQRFRTRLIAITGLFILYLPVAGWYVSAHDPSLGTYDHPILYFLKSCLAARTNPAILTMKTSVGSDDFLPAVLRSPALSRLPGKRDPSVRNVILFVMESVGAEYVEEFGGKYPVTPTISRYRSKAALFDRIYAPVPFSSKALWVLECAMYPWITYDTITRARPQIVTASLSGELKHHGYKTAFFSSGDNRYQSVDAFLAHRSFDVVSDCNTMTQGHPTLLGVSKEHGDEGCDDRVTVATLSDWIDRQDGQPFFGMLWTVMTHSPYFPPEPEAAFDQDNQLENRYLNALRASDEALSQLITHLEERGLMDSTLVVVVGDHGEAFGQHNTWGHVAIDEECVHVPLLVINPRLFQGENYHQIGGSLDVAPTILDLLGYPLPGAWQGRSLFSTNRSNRTYFFVPLRDYWFGFREDDLVFLYDASKEQYQVYDMLKDPMQTRNLAKEKRDLLPLATDRLAAWVQFQNRYITELMNVAPSPDQGEAQVAHQ